jgi:phosphonoacetaldehyde hydrolase
VVFDWAGTTVDHGSRAPVIVFQEVFRRRGIEITTAEARAPMGMAKQDHLAAIAAMPDVAQAWQEKYGESCQVADIAAMYEEFLPLQKSILKDHSDVIAGVPVAVDEVRRMGLKIGSSTGYTRALMEIVSEVAGGQGYRPDCVVCVEDAPRGRPAPFLLYEAAKRLNVYPLWTVVVVDDTPVGIEAGCNAGCWTVGVTRTGNGVGLSVDELGALSRGEISRLCEQAAQQLRFAGAHYTIQSVAEIPQVVSEIAIRLRNGELPQSPMRKL